MLVEIDEEYQEAYTYRLTKLDPPVTRYTLALEIDDELFAAYEEFLDLKEQWEIRIEEMHDQADADEARRNAKSRVLEKQLKDETISNGTTI